MRISEAKLRKIIRASILEQSTLTSAISTGLDQGYQAYKNVYGYGELAEKVYSGLKEYDQIQLKNLSTVALNVILEKVLEDASEEVSEKFLANIASKAMTAAGLSAETSIGTIFSTASAAAAEAGGAAGILSSAGITAGYSVMAPPILIAIGTKLLSSIILEGINTIRENYAAASLITKNAFLNLVRETFAIAFKIGKNKKLWSDSVRDFAWSAFLKFLKMQPLTTLEAAAFTIVHGAVSDQIMSGLIEKAKNIPNVEEIQISNLIDGYHNTIKQIQSSLNSDLAAKAAKADVRNKQLLSQAKTKTAQQTAQTTANKTATSQTVATQLKI